MLNYEEVKINALNEINELILNNIRENLQGAFDIIEYEENIVKIVNFNIEPVFKDVINKNKDKIIKELDDLNKGMSDNEEIQFKINEYINSLLSIWKKTILNTKMLLSTKDVVKYLKSYNEEKNYKKRNKNEKSREKLKKKYNLV